MASAIDSDFAAAQQAAEDRKRAQEESARRAGDRSFIAKLIAWAFVILIAWVVIAATVGTYFFPWERLAEPAKYLMTVLGSVMLPVVTLVIGYYFGKEK